jgi:uncharacterized protein YuzE
MRTSYDPEADAMFVWFGPEGVKSVETEEVAPGVMLDFDDRGEVIGIEILYVGRRAAKPKAANPRRLPDRCRTSGSAFTWMAGTSPAVTAKV